MSVYKLESISKTYDPGKPNACRALNDINLEIDEGDLVSIIGESGSGKSTLLHILGCLDKPTSGNLYIDGDKIRFKNTKSIAAIRNSKIGFVLQDFGLILRESVLENVSVPLLFDGGSPSKIKKRALDTLDLLGIKNLANKKANRLSGGQKQRAAIARALVNDPDIILADEPTGSLDSKTSSEIMKILIDLNNKGKTVIIVTHDKNIALQCKRIIEISDGRIKEPIIP